LHQKQGWTGWVWLAKENEVAELDQVLEEKMNAEEKDCPLERPGD